MIVHLVFEYNILEIYPIHQYNIEIRSFEAMNKLFENCGFFLFILQTGLYSYGYLYQSIN